MPNVLESEVGETAFLGDGLDLIGDGLLAGSTDVNVVTIAGGKMARNGLAEIGRLVRA